MYFITQIGEGDIIEVYCCGYAKRSPQFTKPSNETCRFTIIDCTKTEVYTHMYIACLYIIPPRFRERDKVSLHRLEWACNRHRPILEPRGKRAGKKYIQKRSSTAAQVPRCLCQYSLRFCFFIRAQYFTDIPDKNQSNIFITSTPALQQSKWPLRLRHGLTKQCLGERILLHDRFRHSRDYLSRGYTMAAFRPFGL